MTPAGTVPEKHHIPVLSDMTRCALMCAVMCILCPLAIPVGPVPVTPGVFAVFLAVYALGSLRAALTCLLYVMLGAAGLPVFSGYTGGLGKILGPTGGYLTGYVFLALIAGWFVSRTDTGKHTHHTTLSRILFQLCGMVIGLAVCYLFGTAWFMVYRHADGISFSQALLICVFPFLPFDAVKIAAALVTGNALRTALKKACLV